MKVAVCFTKLTDYAIEVCHAFCNSINSFGDNATPIHFSNYNHYTDEPFDLQIKICKYNPFNPPGNPNIAKFRKWCDERPTRKLIIDTEFILPKKTSEKWYSLGLDDIKGKGIYFSDKKRDRWERLGYNIDAFIYIRHNVLVLGQHEIGVSTSHIDVLEWMQKTIDKYHNYGYKVLFRKHPNQRVLPRTNNYKLATGSLEENIMSSCCVIGRTTNALSYAVPLNIPIVTEDEMCIAYPVANHEYQHPVDLKYADYGVRREWLYDLAYSQWSLSEIKSGEYWKFFRRHYDICN
jgi:hypothetical protein